MDQQLSHLIRIAKQGDPADLLKLAHMLYQSGFRTYSYDDRPQYPFNCRLGPQAIVVYHARCVAVVCDFDGQFAGEAMERRTHEHECNLLSLTPVGTAVLPASTQIAFPEEMPEAWVPFYLSQSGYVRTTERLLTAEQYRMLHEDIAVWMATNMDIVKQAEKDWQLFQATLVYDNYQDALKKVARIEREVADAIFKWLQD